MNKREIKSALQDIVNQDKWETVDNMWDESKYQTVYLGSFMYLDPCGRYHHILSPNGITSKCERFWENLDSIAESMNMWIETGEGDPTDIFLCRNLPESAVIDLDDLKVQ